MFAGSNPQGVAITFFFHLSHENIGIVFISYIVIIHEFILNRVHLILLIICPEDCITYHVHCICPSAHKNIISRKK